MVHIMNMMKNKKTRITQDEIPGNMIILDEIPRNMPHRMKTKETWITNHEIPECMDRTSNETREDGAHILKHP